MISIIDEMVPKLRRAIDDEKDPYTYTDNIYTDNALAEHIEDAIDEIYLDWQHDYTVDRDNHRIEEDVDNAHQMLFVLQAKLNIITKKSSISFKAGSFSVTRKSDDQKRLIEKIERIIDKLVALESMGQSITEYDDYTKRLERLTYVNSL